MTDSDDDTKKPGPIAVIGSVISAAFGVQSSKNRERDFTHGRFRNYVITAIIFVGVFIATVYTIVQIVLK
ncbi:DUF2970 domain-containing protein [Zhongshania aquimaris]|uniref:DUF2970 domain-containing protein n=1 Tax=Zhongshania aquimaris TaxID=2857107 RepID=A0ABS6VLI9_9GAMM|nr:DUF2970 domain-containing protein [Zhongshania aquimaris]MBW2939177.1 DUF2970 domain-containing protein [Zhongshania aquimaris]